MMWSPVWTTNCFPWWSDDGFRSFLAIAPEESVAVFVVSNDDNVPVGLFGLAALEVLFPEQAAEEANKD
jgi:hypothetical protein